MSQARTAGARIHRLSNECNDAIIGQYLDTNETVDALTQFDDPSINLSAGTPTPTPTPTSTP